jgi:hypothetical protein
MVSNMNKKLSFARLDYMAIKPYLTLKSLIPILFVIILVRFATGEQSVVIGMLSMYSAIFASYPFAVSDKNGMDTLYATLPLRKSEVVIGRYIFVLFLNIAAGIAAFAVSAVSMIVLKEELLLKETFISIAACLFIFSLVEAFQLPIYFKLGYAKAKMLAYLPLVFFAAAVIAVTNIAGKDNTFEFLSNASSWIIENTFIAIATILMLWLTVLTASVLLSLNLYKSRQF